MDRPGLLSESNVAIIGLGLMGGSLALALQGHCSGLFGVDRDPAVRALASERKVVERIFSDPASALRSADLVILATPVRTILQILSELPALHPGCPVVIDLGSSKMEIVRAMQALPARFDPLGGHPMCGKERSSLSNAEVELFRGARFAFTPLPRTTLRARFLAADLASAVGAVPLWLDPVTHDCWTAATSHLPYLVASALAASTPFEAAPMVGPGFRSTARLAGSSIEMMLDVLLTNRSQVLAALKRFQAKLDQLEKNLSGEEVAALGEALAEGARAWSEFSNPGEKT
jgi:prephenate dehydrogenase